MSVLHLLASFVVGDGIASLLGLLCILLEVACEEGVKDGVTGVLRLEHGGEGFLVTVTERSVASGWALSGGEVLEDVVHVDAGVAVEFSLWCCAARFVEERDEGTSEGDRFFHLGVPQAGD